MRNEDCRVYVGNLPSDVRSKEIEDIFDRCGKVLFVDLKSTKGGRGTPFAFVEFEDPRDATDAVRRLDGYDFADNRLRVEFPRGGTRGRGGSRGSGSGGSGRGPPVRNSHYRVRVLGLPPSGSWQDLKDHMRDAGDVCFADVYKDGTGVVEFLRYEDMKYAIRKMDNTKFRSHEGESSYIQLKEEYNRHHRQTRSRSYSPARQEKRRSRSRSHSPKKKRSVSRSRSRSHSYDRDHRR